MYLASYSPLWYPLLLGEPWRPSFGQNVAILQIAQLTLIADTADDKHIKSGTKYSLVPCEAGTISVVLGAPR